MTKSPAKVVGRCAHSFVVESRAATREVATQLQATSAGLNFLFVSSLHDLDQVAAAWSERGDTPTIACTTAGELAGEIGYRSGSIVGASLHGVRAATWGIGDVGDFDEPRAMAMRSEVRRFVDSRQPHESLLAIVVADGTSFAEERLLEQLRPVVGAVPIVGGSAGDDLRFAGAHVLVDGRFRTGAAVLCLVASPGPIGTFAEHHFQPADRLTLVTRADPRTRRLLELDGLPAAEVYRGMLDSGQSASHGSKPLVPFILTVGGRHYLRSIAGIDGDEIRLYCAVDEGTVLDIGVPTDIVGSLERIVASTRADSGGAELVVLFDCVLRRLELSSVRRRSAASALLGHMPCVGFSTYGEVDAGLHVNQTTTGIVFRN